MLFMDIQNIKSINLSGEIEPSIYTESLDIILESDNSFFNLRKKMMNLEFTSIVSEDQGLLNEGMNEFFSGVVNIFKKLWKAITSLWEKFSKFFSNLISEDEKFIKRHINTIQEKDLTDFKYEGYLFTIEDDIPEIKPNSDFILKDKYLSSNSTELKRILNQPIPHNYKETVYDERHYDELRGKLIGQSSIKYDEFQVELFKVFRDGDDTTSEFGMEDGLVEHIEHSLLSYRNDLADCKKVKREIDDFYTLIISQFNSLKSISSSNDIHIKQINRDTEEDEMIGNNSMVSDNIAKLSTLMSDEARKLSTIYNTAFSMKLEALKDRRQQYRHILQLALNY